LSFYVPSAIIKFGEPYFQTYLADYPKLTPYLQLLCAFAIPLTYVIINMRLAIPKVYENFSEPRGDVTRRILGRTLFASLYLGCTLYVLALALYEMKTDSLSLILYGLFLLLFVTSLASEEVIIRKLMRVEKKLGQNQQFIRLESIIDEKLRKISLGLIIIGVAAFVIMWQFPAYLTSALYASLFFIAFLFPVLGLVFLMFFVYKGDKAKLDEESRKQLKEKQLHELERLVDEMNVFLARTATSDSEATKVNHKKNTTSSKRTFFAATLMIGLLITFGAGGGLFLLYQYAPSYSFNPNYRGFAIARNSSLTINPYFMVLRISVLGDMPILYFRYDFAVGENGTYNFIFIFPFRVADEIGSSEGLNVISTEYGSAIWLKHQVVDVQTGWKSQYVWGEYYIENTFQSGSRGDYFFALPLFLGVGGASETLDTLQSELGIVWHSPDVRVELEFIISSRF
jgi:hypothetical protein